MSAPDLRLAALRRFSVAITVLNVCGRLWHPGAEDGLQGVGRLVDPVVVNFDLRKPRQNPGRKDALLAQ